MKYTEENPKLVTFFYFFEGQYTFTGVVKDNSNTIAYHLNGQYHREDGPAIIWSDGEKHWWLNGKRHRTDGPAIEAFDGTTSWWLNDKDYGYDDDFITESWIRFVELQVLK